MVVCRCLALALGVSVVLSDALACGQIPELSPPVEVAFEQGVAKEQDGKVFLVRYIAEHIALQREEAYPVTVKVTETRVNPTTELPEIVAKDVTEMRTRTVTLLKPVWKQVIHNSDLSLVKAKELGGNDIEAAKLLGRLAKPAVVLVTITGEPIPNEYALLFKPDTIVLDWSKTGYAFAPMKAPALAPPSQAAYAQTLPLPAPAVAPTVTDSGAVVPARAAPVVSAPVVSGEGPVGFHFPAPTDLVLPEGLPPLFRLLSINADDQFVFRVTKEHKQTQTCFMMKTETRLVDGKQIDVKVCVPISVTEQRATSQSKTYPATAVTGQTAENKPLGELHRAALRQREIPVVVSQTGQDVDPLWLQNIKPKMLVLTSPINMAPPSTHGPNRRP